MRCCLFFEKLFTVCVQFTREVCDHPFVGCPGGTLTLCAFLFFANLSVLCFAFGCCCSGGTLSLCAVTFALCFTLNVLCFAIGCCCCSGGTLSHCVVSFAL